MCSCAPHDRPKEGAGLASEAEVVDARVKTLLADRWTAGPNCALATPVTDRDVSAPGGANCHGEEAVMDCKTVRPPSARMKVAVALVSAIWIWGRAREFGSKNPTAQT